MKDDFGSGGEDFLTPKTAEVREAPGYRLPIKKPAAVAYGARRAEAMITLIAAGKHGEAVKLAEEDRARRAEQTRLTIERMTPAQRADVAAGLELAKRQAEADQLRGPEIDCGRKIMVAYRGREMRLHEAVALGYVPFGNEGQRED